MFQSNISSSQILTFLRLTHKIHLSVLQIPNLPRNFKPQVEITETEEIIEFMNSSKEAAFLPSQWQQSKSHAGGFFSPTRLQNLNSFVDFVAIDPTFIPMTSDWIIIPTPIFSSHKPLKTT